MNQILQLVNRSDSIAVKSEGTRVLVNAVKSLWSTDPKTLDEGKVKKREDAMKAIVTEPCVSALARLIGRSKRYPTLINEGVVALSLVSTHPNGGALSPSFSCSDQHSRSFRRHARTGLSSQPATYRGDPVDVPAALRRLGLGGLAGSGASARAGYAYYLAARQ